MSLQFNGYKPTTTPAVAAAAATAPTSISLASSSGSVNNIVPVATSSVVVGNSIQQRQHQFSSFQRQQIQQAVGGSGGCALDSINTSLNAAVMSTNSSMAAARSSASSSQLFSTQNTLMMMGSNSHNNMMMLNAHNHPDRNGRPTFVNVATIKDARKEKSGQDKKMKVYENNHKPHEDPEPIDLYISLEHVFDHGAFGHVRTARIKTTDPTKADQTKVAVKQVLQDKRYRNRELPLMKQLSHRNIVTLLYYYYHYEDKMPVTKEKLNLYLNLVMEFIPSNLNKLIQDNVKQRIGANRHRPPGDISSGGPVTPLLTIKLCMYQIFRALAYIHSHGICHRDIKPNNLLFNPGTGVLKICDFGSAKHLQRGEPHVSYICARFYRAPELLFGATDYNEKIDLWSTGVVFSELLLGQPIFHEDSGIDQLVLIISKLGTPTKEQIKAMNHKYVKYDFPQVYCQPWQSLFPNAPPDALDLISQLFQYDPSHRIAPLKACAHHFFDELREPNKRWFGHELPPLFDFTDRELSIDPDIKSRLMPYKTKPNIAYIPQQPSQQMMNVRMLPGRNQAVMGGSTPGLYPTANLYPNASNFSYLPQLVPQHYPGTAIVPEKFNQSYLVGNDPGNGSCSNNNNNPNGGGGSMMNMQQNDEH